MGVNESLHETVIHPRMHGQYTPFIYMPCTLVCISMCSDIPSFACVCSPSGRRECRGWMMVIGYRGPIGLGLLYRSGDGATNSSNSCDGCVVVVPMKVVVVCEGSDTVGCSGEEAEVKQWHRNPTHILCCSPPALVYATPTRPRPLLHPHTPYVTSPHIHTHIHTFLLHPHTHILGVECVMWI